MHPLAPPAVQGVLLEFMGEVGKFYNVISEQTHQLTVRLILSQMFDHNGTYMNASDCATCIPYFQQH